MPLVLIAAMDSVVRVTMVPATMKISRVPIQPTCPTAQVRRRKRMAPKMLRMQGWITPKYMFILFFTARRNASWACPPSESRGAVARPRAAAGAGREGVRTWLVRSVPVVVVLDDIVRHAVEAAAKEGLIPTGERHLEACHLVDLNPGGLACSEREGKTGGGGTGGGAPVSSCPRCKVCHIAAHAAPPRKAQLLLDGPCSRCRIPDPMRPMTDCPLTKAARACRIESEGPAVRAQDLRASRIRVPYPCTVQGSH